MGLVLEWGGGGGRGGDLVICCCFGCGYHDNIYVTEHFRGLLEVCLFVCVCVCVCVCVRIIVTHTS